MSDKESLVKKYEESKKQVYDILKKLNTFDGIKTLLSFMASLDDELTHELYQLETRNLSTNVFHLAMMDTTRSGIALICEILPMLLLFSNNEKNELSRTPVILTTLTFDESHPDVQNWIDKEFDEEKDSMVVATMQLLEGSFKARRFILFKDFHTITGNEQIPLIVDVMKKFATLRSIQSILRQKIPSRVTSEGKILFDNPTPESSLLRKGFHPRKSSSNENFPFWKENISDISKESLLSTKLSLHAPKQREMQYLEHNKFFDEFIQIPEISKIFERRFNISLIKFRDITFAIKQIALSSITTVVSLPKPRLISKLKKLCNCSKSEIEKVLDIFILKKGDPIFRKYIFYNGFECIYNWSLITHTLDSMMTDFYDKWMDGNKKGIEFEIDCRESLSSQSCLVLHDRLLLPALNTDIDVICSNKKILFIMECKSEARRSIREDTQIHRFEDYYEKLLFKAKWISENYEQFSQLLNKDKFYPDKDVEFIVPLLVTRIQQLNSSKLLTISIEELKEIIPQSNVLGNNSLEILLKSTVTLQIPAFQINNLRKFFDNLES